MNTVIALKNKMEEFEKHRDSLSANGIAYQILAKIKASQVELSANTAVNYFFNEANKLGMKEDEEAIQQEQINQMLTALRSSDNFDMEPRRGSINTWSDTRLGLANKYLAAEKSSNYDEMMGALQELIKLKGEMVKKANEYEKLYNEVTNRALHLFVQYDWGE